MRVSKKQLEDRVDAINLLVNLEKKIWFKDSDGNLKSREGMFKLDISNGGYQLTKIVNDGGGETDLTPRMSARELFYFLQGYLLRMKHNKEINQPLANAFGVDKKGVV
jgi:hypothetical protein